MIAHRIVRNRHVFETHFITTEHVLPLVTSAAAGIFQLETLKKSQSIPFAGLSHTATSIRDVRAIGSAF